jgi:hypothetical protein
MVSKRLMKRLAEKFTNRCLIPITLENNTTSSVIQVDFENISEGEGNLGIEITTSDSAIQYVHLTAFEITKLNGERRYSMNYPKNTVKVKDSGSTGVAIEVERSF